MPEIPPPRYGKGVQAFGVSDRNTQIATKDRCMVAAKASAKQRGPRNTGEGVGGECRIQRASEGDGWRGVERSTEARLAAGDLSDEKKAWEYWWGEK